MNTLRQAVHEYLGMRRALGVKLRYVELVLLDFVGFLERQGASHITVQLALSWTQQLTSVKPVTRIQRLCFVRGFARYRSAFDPCTEIPPGRLLPNPLRRPQPYIYTEQEIARLLEAAWRLAPANGLRPWTYYCLFGLLSVTGLRLGEARELKYEDVDLEQGILTIRDSKFGKSRLVPLHPSTQKVLADYERQRERFLAGRSATYWFVSSQGKRLPGSTIHTIFYALSRQIGLRGPTASHGPRLHDLRHRFAHMTLLQWYRSGEDTERRLPVLSTFLGHANIADTYWYLSAWPELMSEAMKRLEHRWAGVSS